MLIIKTIYALFAPAVVMWYLSRYMSPRFTCWFADKRKAIACYCLVLGGLSFAILELHWLSLAWLAGPEGKPAGDAAFNILLVIMIGIASVLAFAVTNIWSACAIPDDNDK